MYCFSNVIRSTKTKKKIIAEVRQKIELGNHNLFYVRRQKN